MQKYLVEGRTIEARLMLSRQLDILIDNNCINILDTHMSNCTTTAEEPI